MFFLQTLSKGNNILPQKSQKAAILNVGAQSASEIIHSKDLQCRTIDDAYFPKKPDSTKIVKYHQYYCMPPF